MGQTGPQHHHPLPNSDTCSFLVAELVQLAIHRSSSFPSTLENRKPRKDWGESKSNEASGLYQLLGDRLTYCEARVFWLRSRRSQALLTDYHCNAVYKILKSVF